MPRTHSLFLAALTCFALASLAGAQGGMGGETRRGGGLGGGPRFDNGEEIADRFEAMAALRPLLSRIDLSRSQRDSLDKVEASYKRSMRGYGKAARDFMAKGLQGLDSIPRLMRDARVLRDEEWALVRAYLPVDVHPQFDENASKAREADMRRDRDMRERGTVGGGGMGGGMGGRGGPGGGMGGRGGIDDNVERSGRGLTTEEMANRFERMAELRPVLQRLDLTREQRDSLGRIELTFGNQLQELARTVRAFYASGRPPVDSLRTLQRNASALRDEEWATARAYLPDAMRATFDGNVARIREDEARADERRRPPM